MTLKDKRYALMRYEFIFDAIEEIPKMRDTLLGETTDLLLLNIDMDEFYEIESYRNMRFDKLRSKL